MTSTGMADPRPGRRKPRAGTASGKLGSAGSRPSAPSVEHPGSAYGGRPVRVAGLVWPVNTTQNRWPGGAGRCPLGRWAQESEHGRKGGPVAGAKVARTDCLRVGERYALRWSPRKTVQHRPTRRFKPGPAKRRTRLVVHPGPTRDPGQLALLGGPREPGGRAGINSRPDVRAHAVSHAEPVARISEGSQAQNRSAEHLGGPIGGGTGLAVG